MIEENGRLAAFTVERPETSFGQSDRVIYSNGLDGKVIGAYEEVPSFLSGFSQLYILEDEKGASGIVNSPLTVSSEDTNKFYAVARILNEEFDLGVPITDINKRHLHIRDLAQEAIYSNWERGIELRVNTLAEHDKYLLHKQLLYESASDIYMNKVMIWGAILGGSLGILGGSAIGASIDPPSVVRWAGVGSLIGACGGLISSLVACNESKFLRKKANEKIEHPGFMLDRFYKANSKLSHIRSEEVSQSELGRYRNIVSKAVRAYYELETLHQLIFSKQGISISYCSGNRENVLEGFKKIKNRLDNTRADERREIENGKRN